MKKATLCLLIIFSCCCSVAFGFVAGSSNLSLFRYPEFDKYKPSKPYSKDDYSMNSYRQSVNNYVSDAKQYIEAANNDIRRIEEAKEEAARAANSAVDEYNSFIRYGY